MLLELRRRIVQKLFIPLSTTVAKLTFYLFLSEQKPKVTCLLLPCVKRHLKKVLFSIFNFKLRNFNCVKHE